MKNKIIFIFLIILTLIPGCSKKASVDFKDWDSFQDQFFKVTFVYPKDWYVVREPDRVLIYNSVEVADKFFTHDPRKPDGVQIIVAAERIDTMQDYSKYIDAYKSDQENAGFTIKSVVDVKIEGLGAKQVTYAGAFDEQTKITAVRAATFKDSAIYYVQYAGFNEMYEPYKLVFDSVINTLTLPKPKIKSKDPNAFVIPSVDTKIIKNNVLDVSVPENMNDTYPPSKGEVTFAMNLKIYRDDCTIDIDVRPAKKLTLEKIVEQNSKKISNVTGKGTVSIGGEKAQYLNYITPKVKGVKSRIYFLVKNDKMYRIFMNYYGPMEKDFLPAFEKVIASIRLK
jgi:hypothetical protein